MKNKIVICEAEPYHLDKIYEIEINSFNLPWTKELLLNDIVSKESIILCAYYRGNMAGFCGLTNICGEGHITNIAVDDKYRRHGIGSALIAELISCAEKINIKNFTLEVRVSNISAIKLYEKFGFINVGVRKRYYIDNNEDAIIMWLMDEHQKTTGSK